ncbi:short-chain dehydrogenase, partial [Streptomyces cavourensis]
DLAVHGGGEIPARDLARRAPRPPFSSP